MCAKEKAIDFYGLSCEIKSLMNDFLCIGEILEFDETEGSMDIVPRNGDLLATLPFNQVVKLVVNLPKLGFRLFLGRVYLSSGQLLRLVDMGLSQTVERRQYFRLNVEVQAELTIPPALEGDEAQVFMVEIKDVSLGGMRILTNHIFEPSEQLSLSFKLLRNNMEMMCSVCREINYANTRVGMHQYGLRFIAVTERQLDRLCGDLFELQRMVIRKKKERLM